MDFFSSVSWHQTPKGTQPFGIGPINRLDCYTAQAWCLWNCRWGGMQQGHQFSDVTGLILGLRLANERRRYFVRTPPIGWAQDCVIGCMVRWSEIERVTPHLHCIMEMCNALWAHVTGGIFIVVQRPVPLHSTHSSRPISHMRVLLAACRELKGG